MSAFRYPRCFENHAPEQVDSLQLHVFADASEMGFAVVAYLRFTIPKLELQAAVMAVRLSATLLKELDLAIQKVFYWSDSMTTLQYIHNQTRRFHTFIANRVAEIHENS